MQGSPQARPIPWPQAGWARQPSASKEQSSEASQRKPGPATRTKGVPVTQRCLLLGSLSPDPPRAGDLSSPSPVPHTGSGTQSTMTKTELA